MDWLHISHIDAHDTTRWAYAMKTLAGLLLLVPLSSSAQYNDKLNFVENNISEIGRGLDLVTTYIGIASGAAKESNPIVDKLLFTGWGDALLIGFNYVLFRFIRSLHPNLCRPYYSALGGIGWGAVANNLLIIVFSIGLPYSAIAFGAVGAGSGVAIYENYSGAVCNDQ